MDSDARCTDDCECDKPGWDGATSQLIKYQHAKFPRDHAVQLALSGKPWPEGVRNLANAEGFRGRDQYIQQNFKADAG